MEQNMIASGLYERRNAVFALEPPFPTKQMSIEISNICNHKCVFCPHHKMTRPKRHIDEGLLYRVLQEAYELGMREVGLFILGEPFASPKLADYIAKAKEMGYTYVYITTNGALATPERLTAVFEAGLDSIKFSINAGSKETYREIHGVDDFEDVTKNVKWCYEYRKTSGRQFNLLCSFVVTALSQAEAMPFYKKFSCLFDDIAFYGVKNRGGLMPEAGSMLPTVTGRNKTERCPFPFSCVYITCEGFLSPCALDANTDLIAGDLNKTTLKEAWYGGKMKALRSRLMDGNLHPQCADCYRHEGIMANILDVSELEELDKTK